MGEIYIPVTEKIQSTEDRVLAPVVMLYPEVSHDNRVQRLLYSIGERWHRLQQRGLEAPVPAAAIESWKIRRKALIPLVGALSVTAAGGLTYGLSYRQAQPHSKVKVTPAPVVCEFSPETIDFKPAIGQGWRAGLYGKGQEVVAGQKPQSVQGVAHDAVCEAQLLDHLADEFGEPHYDEEYRIPAEVHRVTTTTTTQPQ
jgi:hypothetical protein